MLITYFILLFMLPIFLSIILNFKIREQNLVLREDLKYISFVMKEIIKMLTLIFLFGLFLKGSITNNDIHVMFFNIIYFSIFLGMVIFVNYFSTRCLEFRVCIKTLLEQLIKFIKGNFILNLIFIVLIVFNNNNNLSSSLIGSYVFFMLTTINDGYKKNIICDKPYKKIYKLVQFLLNFTLILSFISIERIIADFSKGNIVNVNCLDILRLIIFLLFIVINSYLPKIEKECDKYLGKKIIKKVINSIKNFCY